MMEYVGNMEDYIKVKAKQRRSKLSTTWLDLFEH